MEDFPARFAGFLEEVAAKVRGLTVDRVAKVVDNVSLSIPLTALITVAVIFLVMTIHGALAIPLGSMAASGILGGLFLVSAVLLWVNRKSQ